MAYKQFHILLHGRHAVHVVNVIFTIQRQHGSVVISEEILFAQAQTSLPHAWMEFSLLCFSSWHREHRSFVGDGNGRAMVPKGLYISPSCW